MSQIKFDEISTEKKSGNKSSVGFFGLKQNGEEALVRIMHDTTETFDIVTVHTAKVDGRFRKINCLRNPREPMDKCPLCAAGVPVSQKIYVHLIKYSVDANGQVVAEPMIWERPIFVAQELKNKIATYGPLSQSLFVVKRNGNPGDLKTTYSIDYAPPMVYPNDKYPIVPNAFDNFNTIGVAVMNKSFDELTKFVGTGRFDEGAAAPSTNTVPTTPTYTQPAPQADATKAMPWETQNNSASRPVRY